MIGGNGYGEGGGYADGTSTTSSVGEMFAFDDALSNIRRQQMERYLCDKYEIPMSSSEYLSSFKGGPSGLPLVHSINVASPLTSSASTYARKYIQEDESPYGKIHYETVAGAFLKPAANTGITHGLDHKSGSVSLRSWVKLQSTGAIHAGSQFALVARAPEPYGHKMDNIKGYAAKFGTFKDGVDTGILKFRLGARNATLWSDGDPSGFGDTDTTPTFAVTTGSWYQMRLDVERSGAMVNADTGYTYTTYSTKAFDFNSSDHDQYGEIGSPDIWNRLVGNRQPPNVTGSISTHFTYPNRCDKLVLKNDTNWWATNLWDTQSSAGKATVSFWIFGDGHFTLVRDWPRLFAWGGWDDEPEIKLYTTDGLDNTPNLTLQLCYGGSNTKRYFKFQANECNLSPYAWNHVAITWQSGPTENDAYSNPAKLYLNGVEYDADANTLTSGGTDTFSKPNYGFYLGSHRTSDSNSGNNDSLGPALIRDLGIWNDRLTAAELAAIYNKGTWRNAFDAVAAKQSNCLGYYELTGAVNCARSWSTSSKIQVGTHSYWNTNLATNNGDVTFMGWFKGTPEYASAIGGTNPTTWQQIFGAGSNHNDRLKLWLNEGSGYLHFNLTYGGSTYSWNTANHVIKNSETYDANGRARWHHIAVTMRRSATWDNGHSAPGNIDPIMYIDGQAVSWSSTPGNNTGGQRARNDFASGRYMSLLGGTTETSVSTVNGAMAHWGIWNCRLTANEVLGAFNGGTFKNNSSLQNSHLKGYWSFETPDSTSSYTNFDGNGDVLQLLRPDFWGNQILGGQNNKGKVSFSGWIYSDWSSLTNSSPRIWEVGSHRLSFYWEVADSRLMWIAKYGDQLTAQWAWDSFTPTDNTWQHYAVTFDYGATYDDHVTPILYVNGVSQGNGTNTAAPNPTTSIPDFYPAPGMLLGNNWSENRDFNGRFKHFGWFGKVLTQSEVTALYNSGTPIEPIVLHHKDPELIMSWAGTKHILPSWPDMAWESTDNHWGCKYWGNAYVNGLQYPDSTSNNNATCTYIWHHDRFVPQKIMPTPFYVDQATGTSVGNIKAGASSARMLALNSYHHAGTGGSKNAFTVMGWMYNDNHSDHQTIIEWSAGPNDGVGSSNYHNHGIYLWDSGELTYCTTEDEGERDAMQSTTTLPTGQWNHFAVTVMPHTDDAESNPVIFYINGQRSVDHAHNLNWGTHDPEEWEGFGQGVNNADDISTRVGLGFGYPSTGPNRELRGKLSDLALYRGVLPHQHISAAYNDGNFTRYGGAVYNVNNIVTSSTESWQQVGYWRMGAGGYVTNGVPNEAPVPSRSTGSMNFYTPSSPLSSSFITSSATQNANANLVLTASWPFHARTDGKDTLRLYAREDSDDSWELLTTKEVVHQTSNAYRYLLDEDAWSTSRTPITPAGGYQGYWVAVSSSTGNRATASYHVDNFEAIVSSSTGGYQTKFKYITGD